MSERWRGVPAALFYNGDSVTSGHTRHTAGLIEHDAAAALLLSCSCDNFVSTIIKKYSEPGKDKADRSCCRRHRYMNGRLCPDYTTPLHACVMCSALCMARRSHRGIDSMKSYSFFFLFNRRRLPWPCPARTAPAVACGARRSPQSCVGAGPSPAG